ncbi:leucine-rich repeat-containing protein 15-like isoform X2 [Zophobas morio]|uniref:leucine-rich repeat-containing protein 15-like isoform X2 n=1 Tax=Zophobas morio TaxID=2755281 RepID=UPI00308324B3
MRMFLVLLLFFHLISSGFCVTCSGQEYGVKSIALAVPYNKCNGYYCRQITHEDVGVNLTITCSTVYSISQISFPIKEYYETVSLITTNSNISIIHLMEFHNLSSLTEIYLRRSHIENISPGAFIGLSNLTKLYLDGNNLTEISNGIYNILHHLEIFSLTNNNIDHIENAAIVGLKNLKELHLKNNKLTKIDNNFFETLNHLTYVDISENPLDQFPLSEVSNVEDLLLARTNLTDISEDMSNLTLKLLDLSFCQISEVDFAFLPQAEEINLSGNEIFSLKNFPSLDTLTLNLNNNCLEEVLNKTTFGTPGLILVFEVGYNSLPNFDNDFFHDFTSLEILKLQYNKITEVSPLLFRYLTNLIVLDLSGNQIRSLQYGVFDNLESLESLNISGNKLVELHQNTFHSLSKLTNLHFDSNQISSLNPYDFRSHFPNLTEVSLDKNPWICSHLVKIDMVFKSLKIRILGGNSYEVENFRGIPCSSSKNYNTSLNGTDAISFADVEKNMQKAINKGIENSKIDLFFNENFENSNFIQFFKKNYVRSGFFKYFNGVKIASPKEDANGTKAEEFTALEETSDQSYKGIFVISVVTQIVMLSLLVIIVYLMFTFVKKYRYFEAQQTVSEMELC